MTLIFSGNNYKYELEGIMKLFIPATLFKQIFTDTYEKCEGDYAFLRRVNFKNKILLYCVVNLGGKTARNKILLSKNAGDGVCEMELSKLLFKAMSRLTGKKPAWGVLTGVRPVKRVNSMLTQGISEEKILKALKNDFYVDGKKAELALLTAKSQQRLTENLDKNSFSLYVSIPFCPSRCLYCSFVSQEIEKWEKIIPEYVDRLCEEIEYTGKLVQKIGLKLDTVYFGGGTPTTLSAGQLERLMKTIKKSFDMSGVREYTVEAGRADTITEEKLRAVKENGCTRISINPQTLNDDVLKAIGRRHTAGQFFESLELARRIGFESINTDIIAGLPTDTAESFQKTVDKILGLAPENITVHTLSIKRAATLNQSEKKNEALKNPAAEMVDYASKKLLESGYHPYYLYRQKNMVENLENIGWARSERDSLYNIYIMEEIQTIFAVGAGGSTKLVDLDGRRLERIFNYKLPIEYIKNFDLMLKKKKAAEDFYAEKE